MFSFSTTLADSVDFIRPLGNQEITSLPADVTFECELSDRDVIDVTWSKGSKVIKALNDREKYEVTREGATHKLVVKNVDSNDVGEYSIECNGKTSKAKLDVKGVHHIKCILCKVHMHFKVQLSVFIFVFSVAPQILMDANFSDALTMHVGKTLILEVKFSSSPQPNVSWTFNQGRLPDPRRITHQTIFGMTALTLTKAEVTDAGTYTLLLENEHGKATQSVKVKVLDRPGKPEHVKARVQEEGVVSLSWGVPTNEGGAEVFNYVIEKRDERRRMWQKCGETRDCVFNVDKLQTGNSYNFRIIAENLVGFSEPAELPEAINMKTLYCKLEISPIQFRNLNNTELHFICLKFYF